MYEFDEIDKKVEQIRKENAVYLKDFSKWLKEQRLSVKSINNHVSNVDFYINDYLCYSEPQNCIDGCSDINGFLGDWFIEKATWSSASTIKSTAASIKKFYLFMFQKGKISKEDYDNLCETIKSLMPEWLENMKEFDNMLYDDDEDDEY